MKILLSLSAFVLLVAATPSEVAPVVARDGFFIEQGADATPEVVGNAVADARFAGGALSVVVLSEEPPAGATTFADAVLDGLASGTGTVLVVGPETVGWSSSGDIWTNDELDAALDASLSGASSDDVVRIFVAQLVEPSSSGGGSGALIFFGFIVLIVGAFAFFAFRASKQQKQSAEKKVEELRATAQLQIDAIANDILDLEDEVKLAKDPKATEHYAAAVDTYTTASERLAAMSSGKEIVDFDYELDIAVWRLDAAEAIIDGNPLPDKPEPPVYAPTPAPPKDSTSSKSGGSTAITAPLPEYKRRSTRRSSYGASEMLATVLATQAMRGMGGRRRSGSSGRSRSSGGGSRSTPRMRGGGRRR